MADSLTDEQRKIIDELADGCPFDTWADDMTTETLYGLSEAQDIAALKKEWGVGNALVVARGYWSDYETDGVRSEFFETTIKLLQKLDTDDYPYELIEAGNAYIDQLAKAKRGRS